MKLIKQNYKTKKGLRLHCYKIALSKEVVNQANIKDVDNLKVYAKENKIIIEKGN